MLYKIDDDSDYYEYDSVEKIALFDAAHLWKGFHPTREESIPANVDNLLFGFRKYVSEFAAHLMALLFGTTTEPFKTTLRKIGSKLDSSVEGYGLLCKYIILIFLDDRYAKFQYDSNPLAPLLGDDPKTIKTNWARLSADEQKKTIDEFTETFMLAILIDREALKDYAERYKSGEKPPFLYKEVRKPGREATGQAKNKTRIVPGKKTMRSQKNDFRKGWQAAFKAKAKQKAKKLEPTRITEISATTLNAIYKKAGLTKNDYDPAKNTLQQWAKEVRDDLRHDGYDVPNPVGRSKS